MHSCLSSAVTVTVTVTRTVGEMDAATVASIQTQFESDIVPELRALSAEHCTMKASHRVRSCVTTTPLS